MIDPDRLVYDDEDGPPTGPVEPGRIDAWERRVGRPMPRMLRLLYERGDGGYIRDASIAVLPIDEAGTFDGQLIEDLGDEADDPAFADAGLFVPFAGTDTGAELLLNYNEVAPGGEPAVYAVHPGEPGSLQKVADSLDELLEAELAADDAPCVDWPAAAGETLADATLDVSHLHDAPASWRQILSREGDALVLLVRKESPGGETRERTALPTPLDPVAASIRPVWPGPHEAHALLIQPVETAGIVHLEAVRTGDGGWKNMESYGVPVYVQFFSHSRDELAALRERLIGPADAARAEAEDREIERISELPPGERLGVLLGKMVEFQEELRGMLSSLDLPEDEPEGR